MWAAGAGWQFLACVARLELGLKYVRRDQCGVGGDQLLVAGEHGLYVVIKHLQWRRGGSQRLVIVQPEVHNSYFAVQLMVCSWGIVTVGATTTVVHRVWKEL